MFFYSQKTQGPFCCKLGSNNDDDDVVVVLSFVTSDSICLANKQAD